MHTIRVDAYIVYVVGPIMAAYLAELCAELVYVFGQSRVEDIQPESGRVGHSLDEAQRHHHYVTDEYLISYIPN